MSGCLQIAQRLPDLAHSRFRAGLLSAIKRPYRRVTTDPLQPDVMGAGNCGAWLLTRSVQRRPTTPPGHPRSDQPD